jgi:serine/threonine protein kinase
MADGLATHITRYEVLGVVGQGAMGLVYRARDPQLDRLVALKTLRPELGLPLEARTRFTQEARAAGRLSHPGIVAIHDVIDVEESRVRAPCRPNGRSPSSASCARASTTRTRRASSTETSSPATC